MGVAAAGKRTAGLAMKTVPKRLVNPTRASRREYGSRRMTKARRPTRTGERKEMVVASERDKY